MVLRGCDGKYIRITIALLGSTSMGSGLWLRFSESTKGFFEAETYVSNSPMSVAVLVALGILMLITVTLSCTEKKCVVQMFYGLVVLLAVAEITVGVLVYVRQKEIGESIVEFYRNIQGKYQDTDELSAVGVTLTFIHNMLHCCGETGMPLSEEAKKTCPKSKGPLEKSCPDLILKFIESKAPLVMGSFIVTGVLLIASLVCLMACRRRLSQNVSTIC